MTGQVFTQKPLRVAVPKGSLFKDSVTLLAKAGLDIGGLADAGRQLVFLTPKTQFYILRPTDVPIMTAHGGVDCAICGKDSLLEADLSQVELADLGFGACRLVVAELNGAHQQIEERYQQRGVLRVATKYPHITAEYYRNQAVQTEIIKMHGNIELAPLVGIADRIVDITASGATLRENNLVIVDEVVASTARFVGNPASVRIDPRVRKLANSLTEIVEREG